MKAFIVIIFFTQIFTVLNAQTDSTNRELIQIPNSEYAVYHYDSMLQVNILTYEYPDLWDLDNDGRKDNIVFISNGGAHAYYHLRIWLSSQKKTIEYRTFYTDFPYPQKINGVEEIDAYSPHVIVQDFDNDKADEIYLNLNNSFATIPENLKKSGVTSKQILIDYRKGELVVIDFKK